MAAFQVSVVESLVVPKPDGPLYGDHVDHARAVEAGLVHIDPLPQERRWSIGLRAIVHALLDMPSFVDWPAEAWSALQVAVEADVQTQVAAQRFDLEAAVEVADAVAWALRRVLAPARKVATWYAPVAVLLGSRLQYLRQLVNRRVEAVWYDGLTTTATVDIRAHNLVDALTPRWCAPTVVQHTDGRTWDSAALRIGETVAWSELDDRSLLEIAAFESYRLVLWRAGFGQLLAPMLAESSRRDLNFALAEARYRNLLLAPDDLRVACDHAQSRGALVAEDVKRFTLVELWARCMLHAPGR